MSFGMQPRILCGGDAKYEPKPYAAQYELDALIFESGLYLCCRENRKL